MPDRIVALLLNEWRCAERDLQAARPRDRAEAQRRVDSLRTAYHEAACALQALESGTTLESGTRLAGWPPAPNPDGRTAAH